MIFKWLKNLFSNNTPIKEGGIVYLNTPDVMPQRPTSPMEKLPIQRKRINTPIKEGGYQPWTPPFTVGYLKNGRETRLEIKDKDKFMKNKTKQEYTFVVPEGDSFVIHKLATDNEVEYQKWLHKSRFAYGVADHGTIWILKNIFGGLTGFNSEDELKKYIENEFFKNKQQKTLLISFRVDFSWIGTLSGEALMRESVWESIKDKEWQNSGVLGKHSEVEGEFSCSEDFKIKELTDAQLESLADIFELDLNDLDKERKYAPPHINITGFNPYDCIKEDIEDEE